MPYNSHLYKLDVNGYLIFDLPFQNALENEIQNIQFANDGNLVATGTTMTVSNNYDVFLSAIDTSGNILWTKNFGGGNEDRPYFVQSTSDSGFAICGNTQSLASNAIYLIKTDVNGDIITSISKISERTFLVSPNPASSFIKIDLSPFENDIIGFSIVNSIGQVIISNQINSYEKLKPIDVSNLNNGFYNLILFDKYGILSSSQIIIIH